MSSQQDALTCILVWPHYAQYANVFICKLYSQVVAENVEIAAAAADIRISKKRINKVIVG